MAKSTTKVTVKRVKNPKNQANVSLLKLGKDFESDLTPKLKNACKKRKFGFTRFYDSYSSQGFRLPAQFSDYHITTSGSIGHYVEFKFISQDVFSFQKLNDKQWAGLVESIEFGYNYWILVYSQPTERFYLMHSTEVQAYFGGGKMVRSREFSMMDAIKLPCFANKSIEPKKAIATILEILDAKK